MASPVAIALTLCDYVVVEEGTHKVSLIGMLKDWRVRRFPFVPPRFFAHVALTDGLGDVTISLVVSRLETNEDLYSLSTSIHFADKLREKQVVFRIAKLSIPAPGAYQFTILANGEWTGQRRVEVLEAEES